MLMWNLVRLSAILLAGLTASSLGPAAAQQAYPSHPITLIVPFPPGGSTSVVARIVAERMSETLGQTIVVDNRGGAGGTVGTRAAARSAPDGYTILLGYTGTLAIGPSLHANAGFDPRKDFAPIGMIGESPMLVLVHPSVPAKTLAEFVALAKTKTMPYASAGNGTVGHVAAELLASTAGIKMMHVPYRGTGPAINDLVGGHVPMSISPVPPVLGNVQAGTLRAIAITSAKRSAFMPDVATVAESGFPGFEAALRYGLVAPAGTPRPIIDRLNKELRAAVESAVVRERLAKEGATPIVSTPEEYGIDIDREETKWSKIVRESGAKAE
jgi:tripartite-type tricarboxylate transporter receptor subunit TctC